MKELFKAMMLAMALLMSVATSIKAATPPKWQISGIITEKTTGEPIPGVAVLLGEDYLWTISDLDGSFSIKDIQEGEYDLKTSCLGFVDYHLKVKVNKNIKDLKIVLQESSLALDEVVVTAQRAKDGLSTSHQLGKDALNHLQLSNMSDITSLLPGGKTVNPDLTKNTPFSLRQSGSDAGNAAFGTAVEVDGVRLGGNAGFDGMSGAGTRNVAVENIESIEVITGVPSAEYGDLNSGLVKIHTRNGRSPVNVVFSVNPKTWQVSAAKGIDLQQNKGILNVSAEWARATKKLVSPYESYSRTALTATYSNTFKKKVHFTLGVDGNLGGMNSKDDPDASRGSYEKAHDNAFRAHTNLDWMINKPGITSLKFNASVNFQDLKEHQHQFRSSASAQPAVHAEKEGYWRATTLPEGSWFEDRIDDSKALNIAAALKYEWNQNWNGYKSRLKAGMQYKADGNVGAGKYYLDPELAKNGYRPRPYTDYPFLHNLSIYAEERMTLPVGKTKLEIMAGLRLENVFIKGTRYKDMTTLSPRFNLKWEFGKHFAIRGGWGVTEKLPSFYILYPEQEYRDISSFTWQSPEGPGYVYYTQPYQMEHNPNLKWQRNNNSEFGFEVNAGGFSLSLVGFYNLTRNPFLIKYQYSPFAYNTYRLPSGYQIPAEAEFKVDPLTGQAAFAPAGTQDWTLMEFDSQEKTFVGNKMQANGNDIHRAGIELTADFPEIRPIRTSFRLDASYNWSSFLDDQLTAYYPEGTTIGKKAYPYVGIYASGNGKKPTVSNGLVTHNLNANLTSITHIPQARIIITCKLEVCFLKMSRNRSEYQGKEYAYNVEEIGTQPVGGSIYSQSSYTAIRPIKYMDTDGIIRDFTDADAENPELKSLILKSGNIYTFAQDGYTPYVSANLSITKEIGKTVSVSFFANNFTNSRMLSRSWANGQSVIYTPSFYYGLTCRLKF